MAAFGVVGMLLSTNVWQDRVYKRHETQRVRFNQMSQVRIAKSKM